jgi:hypothetical protein
MRRSNTTTWYAKGTIRERGHNTGTGRISAPVLRARPPRLPPALWLFAIFVARTLRGTVFLQCPRRRVYLNGSFIYSGAWRTMQRRRVGNRRGCGLEKRRRLAQRSSRIN